MLAIARSTRLARVPARCLSGQRGRGDVLELEAKHPRDRRCLGEAHEDPVREGQPAGPLEGMPGGVQSPAAGKARHRHEPLGAAVGEGDEDPRAMQAGDPALEARADPCGEEGRDISLHRRALRGLGAALGAGHAFAGQDQVPMRGRGAALAEREGMDQGSVHDEVGVAPDRRGEMRVARQREAEMAEVRATAEYWMAVSELLVCCGLEDLETMRELVAEGGGANEGGIKR